MRPASALFAASTTGTSTGAVNSFYSSFTALGGGLTIFMARVRAAARRGVAAAEPLPTMQNPDFVLDFASYRATRGEQEIRLTPTELRLLAALAATPGHLVTHGELLRAAWGPSYGRESNYLRVYTSCAASSNPTLATRPT